MTLVEWRRENSEKTPEDVPTTVNMMIGLPEKRI